MVLKREMRLDAITEEFECTRILNRRFCSKAEVNEGREWIKETNDCGMVYDFERVDFRDVRIRFETFEPRSCEFVGSEGRMVAMDWRIRITQF